MSTFRRRPLELAVALALAGLTLPSHALKLGDPVVRSYVGQPLVAEYPILDSTPEEMRRLSIALAKPELYSSLRANFHPALKTSHLVVVNQDGKHNVIVTTEGPVEDSVLDIVFELTWAAGRMVQSSTVLIDAAPGNVAIDTPYFAVESIPSVEARDSNRSPVGVRTIRGRALPAANVDTEIVVRRGDTLGSIAKRALPDVPLEQALLALYNKNSQIIASKNVNLIREGVILQVPTIEEARAVDATEAIRTLRVHAANFREYTARLAQQSTSSKRSEAGVVQSGSLQTPTVTGEKEPSGDAVRIGAGKSSEASTAIQNAKAKKEAEERQSLLEKNTKALEELANIRNAELAKLQAKMTSASKSKNELTPPPDKNPNPMPVAPTSEITAPAPIASGLVNPSTLIEPSKSLTETKPKELNTGSTFKGTQPVVETPTLPDTMKPSTSISDPSGLASSASAPVDTASAPKAETSPPAATPEATKVKPKPKAKPVVVPPPPPPPEPELLDYWPYAAGGVGILALLGGWFYTRRKQSRLEEEAVDMVVHGTSDTQGASESSEKHPHREAPIEPTFAPELDLASEHTFSTLATSPAEMVQPAVDEPAFTNHEAAATIKLPELPPFDLASDDHALNNLTLSLATELPELHDPLQGNDRDTYPVSVSYDPDEQLGIAKFYLGLQDFRGAWDMLTPLLTHERESVRTQAHTLLNDIPEEQRLEWESESR